MYPDYMVEKMNEYQKNRHFEMKQLAEQLLNNDWLTSDVRKLMLGEGKTDVFDYFKKEGYWSSNTKDLDHYPIPETGKFKQEDMDIFLPKLKWVEEQIPYKPNKNYKPILKHAFKLHFMGYSQCRCCGKSNGTGEYYFQGWAWPDGYMHYLVEHKVEPSAAFMVFINTTYDRFHINK